VTVNETLLTQEQAAEYLGIPAGTLRVWRGKPGRGPAFVKLGRHVRYRASDVEAWVDANVHRRQAAAR
jgi:excisionase family DNA binding protein